MKKIACVVLALAVLVLAFFWFSDSKEKIKNFPSTNTGIVAFGDSLTYGVGSTQSGGFVSLLSRELGVPIENMGVSGETTADALKRVSSVVERKPAVTLILLGGNDFLQRVSEEKTVANLSKIIEEIHASGSAVVLLGLRDSVYKPLSENYETAYVSDVLEGIYGNPQMMSSDGIHPNDAGYKLMSERVRPVLESLLTK